MKLKPAFLNKPGIAEYVSLSVDTLERMVQKGTFPGPRRISDQRVGWLVTEIDDWAANRPRSSGLPVANCGRNQ